MHPLDENPAVNREPNQLPSFLFPSQIATLMLVETEDLIPLFALIVWPIFGAVMALRYPKQALRLAALAPTLSILHFVTSDGSQLGPTYQTAVRNFASLRPPMTYQGKEAGGIQFHVDYPRTCAVRSPDAYGVSTSRVVTYPLDQETGAADSFAGWNAEVVLRVLATIFQRLGGRKRGEAPTRLRYPYVSNVLRFQTNANPTNI